MVEPVSERLRRELQCVDLLVYFYGMNDRDVSAFVLLGEADQELTVDEVAERLGCERSTAYRSISRLLEAGVVVQEQVNYETGGYYHVYRTRESGELADEMRRLLNDWYANVGQLIQEFEDAYGRDTEDREHRSLQSRS
ncbi:helix-turn-helix domain-containing protein [Natronoarchaeum mannanilyticum]|uniref:Helix-turn-helix domain-containing protein n=1 Tax=Natronoarchaeum mannanilyticum TaxID=926360 RepID=A0AAV3TED0_9EURY